MPGWSTPRRQAGDAGLREEARGHWQTAQQEWLDAARDWEDVPLTALACRYQARQSEDRLRSTPDV